MACAKCFGVSREAWRTGGNWGIGAVVWDWISTPWLRPKNRGYVKLIHNCHLENSWTVDHENSHVFFCLTKKTTTDLVLTTRNLGCPTAGTSYCSAVRDLPECSGTWKIHMELLSNPSHLRNYEWFWGGNMDTIIIYYHCYRFSLFCAIAFGGDPIAHHFDRESHGSLTLQRHARYHSVIYMQTGCWLKSKHKVKRDHHWRWVLGSKYIILLTILLTFLLT